MSHYDKAREAYASQSDVRAPTQPTGLVATLMKTRSQLLQAHGIAESIEEVISGPTPSKGVEAAGPSSMLNCADDLEGMANSLVNRLEAIRAKL